MSAFVCDDKHISALAGYAMFRDILPPGFATAELLAAELHRENVASVTHRYRGSVDEHGPFFYVETRFYNATPVQIIKAARCYQYQACEHPAWEGSVSQKVVRAIIDEATSNLPGYTAAAWGWA